MADLVERLRKQQIAVGVPGYLASNKVGLEAADEIERLRAALRLVRGIIVEGAMVGFNPLDGGDWAERLFASQAVTHAALYIHERGGT